MLNLSLLLLIPAFGLLALFFIPAVKTVLIRQTTCAVTLLTSLLAAYFFFSYDYANGGYQFVQKIPWVIPFGISYHVGIDGINALMLLLLGIASFTAALISNSIKERVKEYYILFLIVVFGTYGAFLSLDVFFFYFSHEIATVPIFLMIGIWGSKRKDYAAMKLTLYLVAGAGLALVGLIALYFATGIRTFDLVLIQQHLTTNPIPAELQNWIFPLIVIGFGITLTLWPFHTWAPVGYAQAPTAVSMMHAGVLKKMGAYAIIRFAIQLMPEAAYTWMPIIAVLGVMNILFCGVVALTHRNFKYILAYSSCSHMGYILLGLACFNTIGLNGVVYLMFAHGIMATLAFALAGYITDQTKTSNLDELGGLTKAMPFVGTLFIMTALASAGVPGFANFIAEIMVMLASWDQYRAQSVLAVLGIVLTAIYMLKMIRLGFQGPLNSHLPKLTDSQTIGAKAPFVILMAVLILTGCWPAFILNRISSSTKPIIEHVMNKQ